MKRTCRFFAFPLRFSAMPPSLNDIGYRIGGLDVQKKDDLSPFMKFIVAAKGNELSLFAAPQGFHEGIVGHFGPIIDGSVVGGGRMRLLDDKTLDLHNYSTEYGPVPNTVNARFSYEVAASLSSKGIIVQGAVIPEKLEVFMKHKLHVYWKQYAEILALLNNERSS